MDTTVAAGAGHPVVATLLGLGAVALAALVVAMAWSVHVRQFRLAEQLARRQFTVAGDPAADAAEADEAAEPTARQAEPVRAANGTARAGNGAVGHPSGQAGKAAPTVIIDGPETVTAGEQARYRLRPAGIGTVVSWAVGGGSVSQAPDPGHPDELLMIADRPGDFTVIARAREGMVERRATKAVTAVPEAAQPAPPVTLRLFLHSWGLLAAAVLVVGFAGALDALGSLSSSDFIALVVPMTALLGMAAVSRGGGDGPPRTGRGTSRPPS
ncbi:MAG TPA: hypothetical protein VGM53_24385 [Streptosporangiaceae bacterium]|jgi:hypothetical protein